MALREPGRSRGPDRAILAEEKLNLSGADFQRLFLGRPNLSAADLSGVGLGTANLRGAKLIEANLRGADLRALRGKWF